MRSKSTFFDVAEWVDAVDAGDGFVFEGAEYMDERVVVAEMGEEGGFFQCFLAHGGHVGIFNGGIDDLFWVV